MERKLPSSSVNSMSAKDRSRVDGLLNIDKPRDLTSHDVVATVRRLTRVRRVGHAGTLDPQATGLLLIGLGQGTKLTQFLHEYPKTYRATLKLGLRTDSGDAAGKVVEVRPVRGVGRDAVETVLASFQGTIEQIPPMYSALKHQGQRLYTLARQGIEIARQPRRVQMRRLTLMQLSAEELSVEVECSSGTYIRVLADDIGARLGCGAHLAALVRTAIGPYTLAQALTLPALKEAVSQGDWRRHVIAVAMAGAGFPHLLVTSAAAQSLVHGVPPTGQGIARVVGSFEAEETVAVFSLDGILLAMASPIVRSADLRQVPCEAPFLRLRRVFSTGGSC
ncbi:MAG TPA: tRNA pseudouridine(55) synthase TruB [Candidatus Tectomicrobia bacterium]